MDSGPLATGQQFKTKSNQRMNLGSLQKSKDWEILSPWVFYWTYWWSYQLKPKKKAILVLQKRWSLSDGCNFCTIFTVLKHNHEWLGIYREVENMSLSSQQTFLWRQDVSLCFLSSSSQISSLGGPTGPWYQENQRRNVHQLTEHPAMNQCKPKPLYYPLCLCPVLLPVMLFSIRNAEIWTHCNCLISMT